MSGQPEDGRYTHAGISFMVEYWTELDGSVSKLMVSYSPEMGPGYTPDFFKDGWPNKEAASKAAKERAEDVINRWLAKRGR